MRTFLATLIFITSGTASATWVHKPEVGLGYTNNANYESQDKDSDFYVWLREFGSLKTGDHLFSVWLSYKNYFQQSQNDAINWRVGGTKEHALAANWAWDLGIGGQDFTSGSPGTTEENFDYFSLDTGLTREFTLSAQNQLSVKPGYEMRSYTHLNDRRDHRLFVSSHFNFDLNDQYEISPFAELGFVLSSDTDYNKTYFEMGSDWDYYLSRNETITLGLLYRHSSYYDRNVTAQTVVARKRGTFKTRSQNATESQNFAQAYASFAKMLKAFQLKGSLYVNSQNTKSGFEDYNEMGIKGSMVFSF